MGIRKILQLTTLILGVSYLTNKMFDIPKVGMDGWVEEGFEEVKETYRKLIDSGLDRGSSFAVHYNGRLVAHLWGGCKTFMCSEKWRTDTTASLFSLTSFLGGICMAILVDRGLLNYTQPVSYYWPEFGMNGKEGITVEDLLSHRSGLVGIDPPLTLEELDAAGPVLSQRLSEQRPQWKPGREAHYHTLSLGLYMDELFKRIDPMGRSCANFLEMEVIHPLKLDIKIGLRDSNQEKRYAHPYALSNLRLLLRPFLTTINSAPRKLVNAFFWNRNNTYEKIMSPVGRSVFGYAFQMTDYRRLSLLSSNGISTVDSLARLMGLVALSGSSEKEFPHQIIFSRKVLLQMMKPMSNLSWMSSTNDLFFGRGVALISSPTNTTMIGYPGTGGQMAFADPENGIGFAYLTNHLSPYSMGDDPRHLQLQKALYDVIARFKSSKNS